jgi:hypothetical protein
MKTNRIFARVFGMATIASLAIVFSCQEEEDPYATEASYVAEESVTDTYYEDADDMAVEAVASESSTSGGKVSGLPPQRDSRFCAAVDISVTLDIESTLVHPIGEIVIDFGDGCTDPRGNVRKGKIIIHFNGPRFVSGSVITITFEDYVVNGIILKGTRTLTNITEVASGIPTFQVQLDGSVEWPDGSVATRTHCFVRSWHRNTLDDLSDDELHVVQCDQEFAAEGINRKGVEYKMIIMQELVYRRGCPIAVSGKKKFINVETGKEIIIDYGSGECDRAITITVEGNIRTVRTGKN